MITNAFILISCLFALCATIRIKWTLHIHPNAIFTYLNSFYVSCVPTHHMLYETTSNYDILDDIWTFTIVMIGYM